MRNIESLSIQLLHKYIDIIIKLNQCLHFEFMHHLSEFRFPISLFAFTVCRCLCLSYTNVSIILFFSLPNYREPAQKIHGGHSTYLRQYRCLHDATPEGIITIVHPHK